jgi:MtN3 and saliva related transmembrane protein
MESRFWFALWLSFGIMKPEWPMILTNGVCLLLSAFVFTMTVLPRDEKDAVADSLDPDN